MGIPTFSCSRSALRASAHIPKGVRFDIVAPVRFLGGWWKSDLELLNNNPYPGEPAHVAQITIRDSTEKM